MHFLINARFAINIEKIALESSFLEGLQRFYRHATLFLMTFHGLLPYIQVALAAILIVCVLLQQTGASLGGALGGDNFSAGYHTRRGMEKYLFYTTIIVGILFALSAFVALVIQ